MKIPTRLENQMMLSGVSFFFFSFLIYMMPKIRSQGYHFSCGCLQKRRAKRIYLLDPSHKDNELQNSGVQLGVLRVGTPSHPQASFWNRVVLQVWEALLLSVSTLTGLLKKPWITVHQCHVSSLFWPAGTSGFLQYPALDICNGSNRTKQLLCLQ